MMGTAAISNNNKDPMKGAPVPIPPVSEDQFRRMRSYTGMDQKPSNLKSWVVFQMFMRGKQTVLTLPPIPICAMVKSWLCIPRLGDGHTITNR